MQERSRNREGKFIPTSKLAKKVLSTRLSKESYVTFLEIAEQMGKPVSILAREILENFVVNYKDKQD